MKEFILTQKYCKFKQKEETANIIKMKGKMFCKFSDIVTIEVSIDKALIKPIKQGGKRDKRNI